MWKKVELVAWISTALAIEVAIYFTNDMRCLGFLFIPAYVSFIIKVYSEKE